MHWIVTHLMWWTPWVMSKHRNTEARKSLPGTCHIHTHLLTFVHFLDMNLWADTQRLQQNFILSWFIDFWVLHLFLCYLLNIAMVSATPTVVRLGKQYNWDIWSSLFTFHSHASYNTHYPEYWHPAAWYSLVVHLFIILLFNKWLFEPVCVSLYHILTQDGATSASPQWCSMMIRHTNSQQVDTWLEKWHALLGCPAHSTFTPWLLHENLCLHSKSNQQGQATEEHISTPISEIESVVLG